MRKKTLEVLKRAEESSKRVEEEQKEIKEHLQHLDKILQEEEDYYRQRKRPTYKQLAEYLGVSEQAVKQYPKVKRDLMIAGLGQTVETKCNITRDEKQIIANTLFEFVEQNYQDSTRDEEIKKIRSIYKKLYSEINEK